MLARWFGCDCPACEIARSYRASRLPRKVRLVRWLRAHGACPLLGHRWSGITEWRGATAYYRCIDCGRRTT